MDKLTLIAELNRLNQKCAEIVSSVHGVIPAALINKRDAIEALLLKVA